MNLACRLNCARAVALGGALLFVSQLPLSAKVTSPKEFLGFEIGEDYHLADYQQLSAYWTKLAKDSSRIKVFPIGRTEEGRVQLLAAVSSPANIRKLDRYREISRKLALAENLTDDQARELAAQGKAIVWVSGGLHSTETLGAQQIVESSYRFVSRDDAETKRILDDVIILFVLANPDGMDLVSDWYMMEPSQTNRTYATLPRLYQKYVGHDDNRDFYAVTQSETRNMSRIMFREWFPQIVYDHHQSGPAGTVMFAPPFRDPFNYRMDARVVNGVDAVGAAMMARFLAEGKPGVTVRSGAHYSTWYNGGLRTVGYFHNAICLLTETIGSPTPSSIPFNLQTQLPRADLLSPIAPQPWRFKQSIEYEVTANYAVMDYASRYRADLLWNRYAMGRDAIAAGNRDSWTVLPGRVYAAAEELKKATNGTHAAKSTAAAKKSSAKSSAKKKKSSATSTNEFVRFFRNPDDRDPRGYVISADQPDFATATKFANTLLDSGVKVWRATNTFALAGKSYPAGSLVVPCNQAFRAMVLDAFEPQDHPNDLQYPGGPPVAPYDICGWTLAMQMAVQYDRVFEAVTGPFQVCPERLPLPAGMVKGQSPSAGYYLRAEANEAYRAVNHLLATGQAVQRLVAKAGDFNAGTFYLPGVAADKAAGIAQELNVNLTGGSAPPAAAVKTVRPARVGLWDRYGGSMPSGWTRWILERFEQPFQVVFPPRLDQGKLRDDFDVLVFVTGAIPGKSAGGGAAADPDAGPSSAESLANKKDDKLPPEYRGRRGSVTSTNTIPKLRAFLEAGGTVITIGSSTALADHLGLPVANHLIEPPTSKGEKPKPLAKEQFYIPGSLVQARVDNDNPLAWGLGNQVDFMFNSSPVFHLKTDVPAAKQVVQTGAAKPTIGAPRLVAWYDSPTPLRSGWALGQKYLQDGAAIIEIPVGKGRVILVGPEIAFRAQPHGTFKFLFNGIINAGLD